MKLSHGLALLVVALAVVSAQTKELSFNSWYVRFDSTENARIELYSSSDEKLPAQINVILERALIPLEILERSQREEGYAQDLSLEGATLTRVLSRTYSLEKNDGDAWLNFGKLKAGFYRFTAEAGGRRGSGNFLVSDLGVIVKRVKRDVLLYTVNRVTGLRKPGVRVTLADGAARRETTTDANGFGKLQAFDDTRGDIAAQFGESWAISAATWNGYPEKPYHMTLITDRPVYRPGDTVSFQGTIRDRKTRRPNTTVHTAFVVGCFEDQEIFRATQKLNVFGSFSGSWPLGAIRVGYPRLVVSPVERQATCKDSEPLAANDVQNAQESLGIPVRDFVKPEFTVQMSATERVVQGERVKVNVSAQYLFGAPVAGARVKVNLNSSYVGGFSGDPVPGEFGYVGEPNSDYESKTPEVERVLTLDAEGHATVELAAPKNPKARALRYTVNAEVEDEARNAQRANTETIGFAGSTRVDARWRAWFYTVTQPLEVLVRARDLRGKAVSSSAALELVRQTWVKAQVQNEDGSFSTRWTRREERVTTKTVMIPSSGNAATAFKVARGGEYVVRTRAKDAQGRLVKSEDFVWVSDNTSWSGSENLTLTTKLDRERYKLGDTAKLFVVSRDKDVDLLVTLEADRVLERRIVRLVGSSAVIAIPVTEALYPNVTVHVSYVKSGTGSNSSSSSELLRVNNDAERLKITAVSAPRSKPGANAEWNFRVIDSVGKPAAGAELTVGVVDEAIYRVQEDYSASIFSVLHADRPNLVGTYSSEETPFEGGGGGGGGEDDTAVSNEDATRVRKDFRDTAAWEPSLITDANGEATLRVTYPDNLTTWRLTARAATPSGRAGDARGSALVTQGLIARLVMPRSLVRGDVVNLRGIVNNTTATNTSGRAKYTVTGLSATGTLEAPLVVSGNGRSVFDARVTATNSGEAKVQFGFNSPVGSDALELPITVKPRGYTDSSGFSARGANSFTLPADAKLETSRFKLTLTPSLLAAAKPALAALIAYPYGCTEQTLSKFVPAVLGKSLLMDDDSAKLNQYVSAGVARLESLQHGDGGWGFWQNDESAMDMTAYAVQSLAQAKAAGINLKRLWSYSFDSSFESAVKWLLKRVGNPEYSRGSRALAHRALAEVGKVNRTALDSFAAIADLEPYQLAQVALAYLKLGGRSEARTLLERLKALRTETPATVSWSKKSRRFAWVYYWDDDAALNTALALELLARMEPNSPLVPKSVSWLLQNQDGAGWFNTHSTAAVIRAALLLPKPSSANAAARVTLNGEQLGEYAITDSTTPITVESTKLRAGENTVSVSGNVSYTASYSVSREPQRLVNETNGLKLTRRYDRILRAWDELSERWTYSLEPLVKNGVAAPLQPGESLLVTLEVSPTSGSIRHLQLIDPIPAGFTALDERGFGLEKPVDNKTFDWDYWYGGREFYADRAEFYAPELSGARTVQYVLRAVTPGVFTALPAQAGLMYDPSVTGRSSGATLTVRSE